MPQELHQFSLAVQTGLSQDRAQLTAYGGERHLPLERNLLHVLAFQERDRKFGFGLG